MKILFICSSLEPTQDGVGDYTRMLATALIKQGYDACIIAINDRRLKESCRKGEQTANDGGVEVLRLSSMLSWKSKLKLAKQFTQTFNPDWISLQFVPFGYQIKGLPFNLHSKLKKLSKNVRWHVMFHELSVNKNDSFKFHIWSVLQERIIKSLIRGLKPFLITTNTEVYQQRLKKLDIPSLILPLFSNIGFEKTHTDYQVQIAEYLKNERSEYLIGTLFGNFSYKSWDLKSLLKKLQNQSWSKKIMIVSIGKMSSGAAYWQTLKNKYPAINFLTVGIKDASFISTWLSAYTDFGILATLPELSGKSGSFMAFKEHGIPVFCKEPDGQLKSYNISLDPYLTIVPDNDAPLVIPKKIKPVSLLNETTNRFINFLNSSY